MPTSGATPSSGTRARAELHRNRDSKQGYQNHLPTVRTQVYVPELDRIVLRDSVSKRPFASTQTCRCVRLRERGRCLLTSVRST